MSGQITTAQLSQSASSQSTVRAKQGRAGQNRIGQGQDRADQGRVCVRAEQVRSYQKSVWAGQFSSVQGRAIDANLKSKAHHFRANFGRAWHVRAGYMCVSKAEPVRRHDSRAVRSRTREGMSHQGRAISTLQCW